GVYGVLTTHYTNLKHFATSQEGIVNGAMAFDNQLMLPLFRLDQGKPGSSFAFEIAKKIGLPQEILNDAATRAGVGNVDFDRNLREIARDKRYWEKKRETVRRHEKRLEELIAAYESQMGEIKTKQKEIITQAKDKAEELLRNSNKVIENTIRTIREAQAEKERTKEVREELESFRENVARVEKHPQTEVVPSPVPMTGSTAGIVKRITRKPEEPVKKKKTEALKPGDHVRITGSDTIGEISVIRGKKVQVVSNSLTMTVDISGVEIVSAEEYRRLAPGLKFSQILEWQKEWYREFGFADEWHNHFQGGPTGYVIADPARGQLANASNMLDVTWEAPDGSISPLDGYLDPYFQEIYLDAASVPIFSKLAQHVSANALDDYVTALEREVKKYLTKDVNYGKVAKRMYNIFRLTGKYEEASFLRELFDEPATVLYQIWSFIRTIDDASMPDSSITREQLVQATDNLIREVIKSLEGVEESEIVDHLLKLRDALSNPSGKEILTQEAEAARAMVINVVNNFFYDRLVALPTIKDYMDEVKGK
ncbi:MAG: hypothetical protein HGB17_17035, partial [Syntrophobacteraceae bacterium]|nr:hypothetical protein [Syntrophobacteraceae bacterium]